MAVQVQWTLSGPTNQASGSWAPSTEASACGDESLSSADAIGASLVGGMGWALVDQVAPAWVSYRLPLRRAPELRTMHELLRGDAWTAFEQKGSADLAIDLANPCAQTLSFRDEGNTARDAFFREIVLLRTRF